MGSASPCARCGGAPTHLPCPRPRPTFSRVVLLGDSAHSVWPGIGQGCNAALQACTALDAALRHAGAAADLDAVAQAYSDAWLPEAHAVADLSETSFGEGAPKLLGLINAALVPMMAVSLLHRALPWLVPQPALLRVFDSGEAYSKLAAAMRLERRLVWGALAVAAAVALAWVARLVAAAARPVLAAAGLA